jgi:hypothetical protein
MAGDPWTCRRCGAGIENHDHASWQGEFFCRGSRLQQEFLGEDESKPSEQPSVESPQSGLATPVSCPFCGSPHQRFMADLATCSIQVKCVHCGARSSRHLNTDAAFAAWSGRAL